MTEKLTTKQATIISEWFLTWGNWNNYKTADWALSFSTDIYLLIIIFLPKMLAASEIADACKKSDGTNWTPRQYEWKLKELLDQILSIRKN